jgi:hypothetical protein
MAPVGGNFSRSVAGNGVGREWGTQFLTIFPTAYNCCDEQGKSGSHFFILHTASLHGEGFSFRPTIAADA